MNKVAYLEKPEVDLSIMEELRQVMGLDEDDSSIDEEILRMSGFEFLNKWLEWNGIIGWTGSILNVIQMAYGIDLTEYPFDDEIERSLME